jgi:ABC-type phosphate transport system substrate-binding protein
MAILIRRRFAIAVFGLLLGLGAMPARADMVVVANAHSSFGQLTRNEVINIYMGRYRRLPDGSAAVPFDLAAGSPERKAFYRRLLDKSLEEINAYWARLVFSGRTTPPQELTGPDELLARVAADPHAIGYLDRQQLSRLERSGGGREVKVVFPLPD